jgi:hypothetical protein
MGLDQIADALRVGETWGRTGRFPLSSLFQQEQD